MHLFFFLLIFKLVSAIFYFRPSEAKIDALKAKSVPRGVHNSVGLKTNNEIKAEAVLGKSPGDRTNETLVILEKDGTKVRDDIATTESKNVVDMKEVANLVPDINGIKKLGVECDVVEVSDEKERAETAGDVFEVVESDIQNDDAGMKEKIILESALNCITEATAVEDAPLLDLSSEKADNSMNETKTNTAAVVTVVNEVVNQEAGMREKQQKENDVLKETQVELQDIMKISKIDHDDPLTVYSDSSQAKFVGEEQENIVSTAEVCSSVESSKQIFERFVFFFSFFFWNF